MIGLINLLQWRERWPSLVYAKSREYLAGQLRDVTGKNKRKIKAHAWNIEYESKGWGIIKYYKTSFSSEETEFSFRMHTTFIRLEHTELRTPFRRGTMAVCGWQTTSSPQWSCLFLCLLSLHCSQPLLPSVYAVLSLNECQSGERRIFFFFETFCLKSNFKIVMLLEWISVFGQVCYFIKCLLLDCFGRVLPHSSLSYTGVSKLDLWRSWLQALSGLWATVSLPVLRYWMDCCASIKLYWQNRWPVMAGICPTVNRTNRLLIVMLSYSHSLP